MMISPLILARKRAPYRTAPDCLMKAASRNGFGCYLRVPNRNGCCHSMKAANRTAPDCSMKAVSTTSFDLWNLYFAIHRIARKNGPYARSPFPPKRMIAAKAGPCEPMERIESCYLLSCGNRNFPRNFSPLEPGAKLIDPLRNDPCPPRRYPWNSSESSFFFHYSSRNSGLPNRPRHCCHCHRNEQSAARPD